MADGYQRGRARKKIKLPSGETIFIPVLTTANVLDQNGQETEVSIDNTDANQTRELHVDDLHPTAPVDRDGNPQSGASLNTGSTLKVERIDSFIGLDIITQAQESKYIVDNLTGNDTAPPRFTTHQKTHVYRYYIDPNHVDDNGVFVDAELIDEFSVIDQNGQEHIYFLNNPTNDDTRNGDISGQVNPDDPDLTIGDGSGEGTTGVPVRTDPFQNIINWNDSPWIQIAFEFSAGDTGGLSAVGPFGVEALGGRAYIFAYMTGWVSTRFPSASSGDIFTRGKTFHFSGASFSETTESLSAWTVAQGPTGGSGDVGHYSLAESIAVKATAGGGAYLEYPNAANPEPGWVASTSGSFDVLAWKGTGPQNWYVDNPEITNVGLATNASEAQLRSDFDLSNFSHGNNSIYVFGDTIGSFDFDFSSLIISTEPGGGGTQYLPVAVHLGSAALKDGTVIDGASGAVSVLCKRS